MVVRDGDGGGYNGDDHGGGVMAVDNMGGSDGGGATCYGGHAETVDMVVVGYGG